MAISTDNAQPRRQKKHHQRKLHVESHAPESQKQNLQSRVLRKVKFICAKKLAEQKRVFFRGWQGFGAPPFPARLPDTLRTCAKLHRRLVLTDDPPIEP